MNVMKRSIFEVEENKNVQIMHPDYKDAFDLLTVIFDRRLVGLTRLQSWMLMYHFEKHKSDEIEISIGYNMDNDSIFIDDYEDCNYAFDISRRFAKETLDKISNYMKHNKHNTYYIDIEKFPNLEFDIYEESHDEIIIKKIYKYEVDKLS